MSGVGVHLIGNGKQCCFIAKQPPIVQWVIPRFR